MDIRTLFEQKGEYYKPKRVSNFWNNNYIEYVILNMKVMLIKIETYNYMNI